MVGKERRSPDKVLLRQDILDAAREILVREGYGRLSMRKVAARIEYSPTAIYLHFKNRDDLIASVCEQLTDGLALELQQIAERHSDPLVALRKSLRQYVEFALKHPQHYQAAFGMSRGEADANAQEQRSRTMNLQALELLRRLVEAGVKRKKLAKVDVHTASCALWAGVHGIASLLIVMPDFDWGSADRVVDQLVAALVDGLRV